MELVTIDMSGDPSLPSIKREAARAPLSGVVVWLWVVCAVQRFFAAHMGNLLPRVDDVFGSINTAAIVQATPLGCLQA